MSETTEIKDILKERGSRYGEYKHNAQVSQELKCVLVQALANSGKKLNSVDAHVVETLDMICSKLSRIVCGDPRYPDNFRDIEGYAKLTADELEKNYAKEFGACPPETGT